MLYETGKDGLHLVFRVKNIATSFVCLVAGRERERCRMPEIHKTSLALKDILNILTNIRCPGEHSLAMKTICLVCKKLICETDDEQDLVSHGMHEGCCVDYYKELDLPLLQASEIFS